MTAPSPGNPPLTPPRRAAIPSATRRSHAMRRTLAALLLCLALPAAAEEHGGPTRAEIEAILVEYLLAHPEVVVEALRAYERRQAELQAAQARQAIAERADELFHDPATPIGGDPEGEIVIVEFFDYRCGHCRRSAPGLFAVRDQGEGVKVIYKEFPILGEESVLAARAALAARAQGLYEAFHEALMTTRTGFGEDEILAVAAGVGLDIRRLKADMADPEIDAYLARTHELARALGIAGTPAFIVDGTLYPGALEGADLARLVQDARR